MLDARVARGRVEQGVGALGSLAKRVQEGVRTGFGLLPVVVERGSFSWHADGSGGCWWILCVPFLQFSLPFMARGEGGGVSEGKLASVRGMGGDYL